MDEDELQAWAAELLGLMLPHCCCGAPNAPLLKLKVAERLRFWAYAVWQAVGVVPDLHGDPFDLGDADLPAPPTADDGHGPVTSEPL